MVPRALKPGENKQIYRMRSVNSLLDTPDGVTDAGAVAAVVEAASAAVEVEAVAVVAPTGRSTPVVAAVATVVVTTTTTATVTEPGSRQTKYLIAVLKDSTAVGL